MPSKHVVPRLGLNKFSCPHPDCGALAHQTWFKLFAQRHDKDGGPFFPNARKVEDAERAKQLEKSTLKLLKRMLTREVFFEEEGGWSSLNKHLMNVHLSMCFSCEGLAIWRADELIYPHGDVSIARWKKCRQT